MKFEVGQNVWIIEQETTKKRTKCECCGGTGKLFAKSKNTNEMVECLCPECKGQEKFEIKTKIFPYKIMIKSRLEFYDYINDNICEAYSINKKYFIYTNNIEECKSYFYSLEHLFDTDYNSIDVNKEYFLSIDFLFETEEDAINKCKELEK